MTRIQLLGFKSLLILLFLGLLSCSNNYNFQDSNYVINGFYTHYSNDSLKLSLRYPGDYVFNNPVKREIRSYRKYFKRVTDSRLKKRTFIYQCSTNTKPYFHNSLFLITKDAINAKALDKNFVWCNQDSIAFFQRKDTVDNKSYGWLVRLYPYKQHYLVFIAYAKKEVSQINNDKTSLEYNSYHSMIKEFSEGVFPTLRIGLGYVRSTVGDPFKIGYEAFNKGSASNYLLPIVRLNNISNDYFKPGERFRYVQAALTYNSFLQHSAYYKTLLSEYNSITGGENLQLSKEQIEILLYDDKAIKTILSVAKEHQVLMFNESHFIPRHRYFVSIILEDLRKVGYQYFAIEALSSSDSTLNERGYPIHETGFYTREPAFAALIRDALQLGYTLIPYEDVGNTDRELAQAQNLYNKTLKNNPNTKVLVLAGFDHINEFSRSGMKKRMAEHFKEISGVDPITVNQVKYDPIRAVLKQNKIGLLKNTDLKGEEGVINDFFLINGLRSDDMRASLHKGGNCVEVDLLKYIKEYENTSHLLLYKSLEFKVHGERSVPIIASLWNGNDTTRFVALLKGQYVLVLKDKNENILHLQNLNL